jgi:hypothetical protein
MQTPPGDEEGQAEISEGNDRETTHNFNIGGPYEKLLTRIFDEAVQILPVLALWVLSFAVLIAPRAQKDMVKGLRTEMNVIDGNVAKLFWSVSAPGIAIRCHFMKRNNKIEEKEEQEQEL